MPDPVPVQNEKIAWRNVAGAAVLVSPDESRLYWLNATATRIWELADGSRPVSAIADVLHREFDVDAGTCRADTERLVRAFERKSLLRVEG